MFIYIGQKTFRLHEPPSSDQTVYRFYVLLKSFLRLSFSLTSILVIYSLINVESLSFWLICLTSTYVLGRSMSRESIIRALTESRNRNLCSIILGELRKSQGSHQHHTIVKMPVVKGGVWTNIEDEILKASGSTMV